MKRKLPTIVIACSAAALMLGGCPLFHRNDDDDMRAKVSLNDFVRDQIDATSETSDPINIDNLDFKADTNDDFADILDS